MGYASGPAAYDKTLPAPYNLDSLQQTALQLAKDADVILFFGGLNKNYQQDCEGGDRTSFELPFGQNELIDEILKVNNNTGVILISGNAVAMPWINKVPALIQSWYLGSEAGNALTRVIDGEINPSGKLPFSMPIKLEDNAAHHYGNISYPGDSTSHKQVYEEDILVGYRWFDTKKIKPLFPFGYGLSYTTFEYKNASSDKKAYAKDDIIKLSVELKNTGEVDGAETIQVYSTQKNPSLSRPAKELKGFSKVFLNNGESKVVEIEIPVQSLAFFDDKKHEWIVEADKFDLQIASSSDKVEKTVSILIQ